MDTAVDSSNDPVLPVPFAICANCAQEVRKMQQQGAVCYAKP